MPFTKTHLATEPSRAEIEALAEPTVLEFGTPWCGHCQAAQPLIEQALQSRPKVAHTKEGEEGPQLPCEALAYAGVSARGPGGYPPGAPSVGPGHGGSAGPDRRLSRKLDTAQDERPSKSLI